MQAAEQEIVDTYVTSGQVMQVYWPMLDLGPNATNAAVAAFCAGDQDPAEFWRYHDTLYHNQMRVYVARRDFFVESAAAQGLDLSAFERCLDSDEMLARLQRLDQQRRDEGVRQRPTFKVAAAGDQGELVLGNQAFSVFADVIDAQLAAP